MPRVSVIVPTYNRAELLKQALRTVLCQTFGDYEVIVVDDGSTDDTRQAVESFQDDRIRYIWQENQWLAAARNTGIAHSTGELVAFLDSDDLWFPNTLESLVPAFDRHPSVGLVYSSHVRIYEDISFPFPQDFVYANHQEIARNMHLDFLAVNRMGVDEVLVRRELIEKHSGFDRSLKYCEDWNMWLRLSKEVDFCILPGPLSAVRVHPGQMSKDEAGMMECELGQLRAFEPANCDDALSESILRTEMGMLCRHAYMIFEREKAQAVEWLSRAQDISNKVGDPNAATMYIVDYAVFNSPYREEEKASAAGLLRDCGDELHRNGSGMTAVDAVRYFWRTAASQARRLKDHRTELKWVGRAISECGFGSQTVALCAITGIAAARSLATLGKGRIIFPIESLLPRIADPSCEECPAGCGCSHEGASQP